MLYQAIDFWVLRKRTKIKPKTLLIFRLDLLGDYMMSRAFFTNLQTSGRYKGYTFHLACNEIVKEVVLNFDSETFSQFYFINRPKFLNSAAYRFKILSEIRECGYEVAICPMHTRQFLLESVIQCSGARFKIGTISIGNHMFDWQQQLADSWYDELVENQKDHSFEFYRNQNFFNTISGQDLKILNNKIRLEKKWLEKVPNESFVLLAPGASVAFRRWPTHKFAQIATEIYKNYGCQIFIIGSKSESYLYEEIHTSSGNANYIQNLCGLLSLPEVLGWLEKAKLLVSNESAPVHMAAMVNCPTICISNGNHYGRWNPYPESMDTKITTLYPQKFNALNERNKLAYHTKSSPFDISEIEIQELFEVVKEVLNSPGKNSSI